MERTTITMSKEFKNELEQLKINNESMEEMLRRVIRGSKERIIKYGEPIAFVLEQYDNDSDEVKDIGISWSKLIDSKEGETYDFDYKSSNCINESAKILIKSEDYILVDFI